MVVSAVEVHYPDSDGHFLPPNMLHAAAILDFHQALQQHFAESEVALVVDSYLYYEEGRPDCVVNPDLFVVRNHTLKARDTYKVWEEGRLPDFVLEVISPSSEVPDKEPQKDQYERLGIREYFLYDPDTHRSSRRLQGYRLEGGQYGKPLAEEGGSVVSEELGVSLRAEGARLVVRDAGKDYGRTGELVRHVRSAQARVVEERQARQAAEDEVRRLRRELERMGDHRP